MMGNRRFFAIVLFFSVPALSTHFSDIEGLFARGTVPDRMPNHPLYVGYCAERATPNVLQEALFTQREVDDPIFGGRRYLVPLFNRNFIQEDLFVIRDQVKKVFLHPAFFLRYGTFFEDNKTQLGWISEEFVIYLDINGKSYHQGPKSTVYTFRQNRTDLDRIFYTMSVEDSQTGMIKKYCYFFKDRAHEPPQE